LGERKEKIAGLVIIARMFYYFEPLLECGFSSIQELNLSDGPGILQPGHFFHKGKQAAGQKFPPGGCPGVCPGRRGGIGKSGPSLSHFPK
jgi:hypothetical protein